MKRYIITCVMFISALLIAAVPKTASAQDEQGSVTYQDFYDDLSPYGQWIDYPSYGYVWSPSVGSDFRPYNTNGHWVWAEDYGWTWASDYEWGWAPFHYGRWMYDDNYGWLWIPGYEWSPAWVEWRNSNDYYGWAPLGPQVGADFDVSFGGYVAPVNYWSFVPCAYITSPYLNNYCVDWHRNATIFNTTVFLNNYHRYNRVFVGGPGRGDVERFTHERIRPAIIRQSYRPGRAEFRNDEVRLYRPNIQRGNEGRFAPARVERFNRGENNGVARNRGFENRGFNNVQRQPENRNWNNNNQQGIEQRRQFDNNRHFFGRNREMQQQQEQRNQEQRNQEQRGFERRQQFQQPQREQYQHPPIIQQPRQELPLQGQQRGWNSGNGNERNFQQQNFQRNFERPERNNVQPQNNNRQQWSHQDNGGQQRGQERGQDKGNDRGHGWGRRG